MSKDQLDAFMTGADIHQLKAYVGGGGKAGGAAQAESTVLLHVSHSNLKAEFMEIRFDRHMTVMRVKERVQSNCGTSPSAMTLQLKDWHNQLVCTMDDDNKMLGYYSPEDGWVLHIVDTDPFSLSKGGWLEDVNLVEKYKISDESYNKREHTYRKFKADKLKEDPGWTIEKEMAKKRGVEYVPAYNEPTTDPDHMKELCDGFEVGMRCSVEPGDKRGEVKYVGPSQGGVPLGWWVGVQYDEPVGKNDGTSKGVPYFECPNGYGSLLRPNLVKVGDYPEIDEFASDPDEI